MRKKEPVITTDEWLTEMERLAQDTQEGDGLTTNEIAERLGHSTKWVAGRLRRLKKAGRLEVGRRTIETLSGLSMPVPAYKVLPEKRE